MPQVRIAFCGDVVGEPGRRAFAVAAPILRRERNAELVVVNGENARHGAGLHPQGARELLAAGADGITLGDHALDDERIRTLLAEPRTPICLPWNFPNADPSWSRTVRLAPRGGPPIHVVTLLGRLFMPREVAEPFAQLDEAVQAIASREPEALVIAEIHAEATSEKQGVAWHALRNWPERVVAVVGTHTHVQTADARILGGRVATMTDLGHTGGHESIIGFDPDDSMVRIREQRGRLSLAEGDLRASGALIVVDTDRRCASDIRGFSIG